MVRLGKKRGSSIQHAVFETVESRVLLSSVLLAHVDTYSNATDVTLNLPASIDTNGKDRVTLSAHVNYEQSAAIHGSVMFLDLNVNDYANSFYLKNRDLMPTTAYWLNGAPVRSLGVASVDSNGDANLSLATLLPGDRNILAIQYFSSSTPLQDRNFGHDYDVLHADDLHDQWVRNPYASNLLAGYNLNPFPGILVLQGSGGIFPVQTNTLPPFIQSDASIVHARFIPGCDVLVNDSTVTNLSPIGFELTQPAGLFGQSPIIPQVSQNEILSATATLGLTVKEVKISAGSAGSINTALRGGNFTDGTIHIGPIISPVMQPEPPLPVPDAFPLPSGEVRLYDGDILLNTFTLDGKCSGVYTPAAGSLSLGNHNFRFVYDGNALYAGFTVEKTVEITNTPTSTTLKGLENSVCQNSLINIQAVVANTVPDNVAPTGTVQYLVDGNPIAVVTLGQSNAATISLPVGSWTVTAIYSGDATHQGSKTTNTLSVIAPAPLPLPVVTKLLVSSKIAGNKLKVKAKLLNAASNKTISGKIHWLLDGKLIATSNAGQDILLSPKLANGKHKLVAQFVQTSKYAASSQTVGLKVAAKKWALL